ncbi:hypothetical protein DYB35_004835 [Aphanomyces astaci]|uniref:Uncharacterized protein n=1 Tax=Aphanomyces astaci TaxID=112090 RepID=A0A418DNC1_APHAT|nr:hypothetical protein DYB35_004835 [Aphanomyces astaci]
MVLQSMRRDLDLKTFRGTAGVLNAYLQTTDGFDAFSMFAKSDFIIECVFGWRAIVDYRTEAPDHPSAVDIYNQLIAPTTEAPDHPSAVDIYNQLIAPTTALPYR